MRIEKEVRRMAKLCLSNIVEGVLDDFFVMIW